jgi:hypothetical protein
MTNRDYFNTNSLRPKQISSGGHELGRSSINYKSADSVTYTVDDFLSSGYISRTTEPALTGMRTDTWPSGWDLAVALGSRAIPGFEFTIVFHNDCEKELYVNKQEDYRSNSFWTNSNYCMLAPYEKVNVSFSYTGAGKFYLITDFTSASYSTNLRSGGLYNGVNPTRKLLSFDEDANGTTIRLYAVNSSGNLVLVGSFGPTATSLPITFDSLTSSGLVTGAGFSATLGTTEVITSSDTRLVVKTAGWFPTDYSGTAKWAALQYSTLNGNNQLYIGGGHNSYNTATNVLVYAAANTSTKIGTLITSTDTTGFAVNSGTLTAPILSINTDGNIVNLGATSSNSVKTNRILSTDYVGGTSRWVPLIFFSPSTLINRVVIGGGSGSGKCATEIQFYSAANTTTTGGTNVATIDTTGFTLLTGTLTTPSIVLPDTSGTLTWQSNNGGGATTFNTTYKYTIIGDLVTLSIGPNTTGASYTNPCNIETSTLLPSAIRPVGRNVRMFNLMLSIAGTITPVSYTITTTGAISVSGSLQGTNIAALQNIAFFGEQTITYRLAAF